MEGKGRQLSRVGKKQMGKERRKGVEGKEEIKKKGHEKKK